MTRFRKRYTVDPMYGVFLLDGTVPPRIGAQLPRMCYQLQLQPVWIIKGQYLFLKTRCWPFEPDSRTVEAANPVVQ